MSPTEEVCIASAAGIFQALSVHHEGNRVVQIKRTALQPSLSAQVGSIGREVVRPCLVRTTFEVFTAFDFGPVGLFAV
jgi:uncharacterized protein (DUF2252 family)